MKVNVDLGGVPIWSMPGSATGWSGPPRPPNILEMAYGLGFRDDRVACIHTCCSVDRVVDKWHNRLDLEKRWVHGKRAKEAFLVILRPERQSICCEHVSGVTGDGAMSSTMPPVSLSSSK